jgi:hypothetical protein
MAEHPIHLIPDMGIMRVDRSFNSCKHCTSFCVQKCYARRLTRIYDKMNHDRVTGSLDRAENYYQVSSVETIAADIVKKLDRTRNGNPFRFRWCAMGEPFVTTGDINKIRAIAKLTPAVQHWIPTRAWRKTALRTLIERGIMQEDNVRVLASVDPSNTKRELASIGRWRTMFFGDNDRHPLSDHAFKCPKTFNHGGPITCKNCEGGCFNNTTRHIHLKKH